MADDKMNRDDLDRNLGGTEKQGGQQAPGRQPQDEEKFGQRGGQGAPTNRPQNEDDELGQGGRGGNIGNKPGGGQGGQNR